MKSDHIELGYDDAAGPAVTVVLDVESPVGADARGPHFSHHVVETHGHASADDRAAMLRAAMLLDPAVPASEVRRARGRGGDGRAGARCRRAPPPRSASAWARSRLPSCSRPSCSACVARAAAAVSARRA